MLILFQPILHQYKVTCATGQPNAKHYGLRHIDLSLERSFLSQLTMKADNRVQWTYHRYFCWSYLLGGSSQYEIYRSHKGSASQHLLSLLVCWGRLHDSPSEQTEPWWVPDSQDPLSQAYVASVQHKPLINRQTETVLQTRHKLLVEKIALKNTK